MKKKILKVLGSIFILGLALTGCNSTKETDTSDTKTVTEAPSSTADATEKKQESGNKGANKDASGKTVLTFWCHNNEPWKIAYEEMAAKFMAEYPEYEVIVESYPMDVYGNKIQTSLTDSSSGADIVAVWGGMAPAYIQSDGLSKVPEDLVAELESDYLAPTLGIYKKEGTFYGVPMEFNLEYGGMIVNKKMFEEAGYDYPTTWEELRTLSKEASVSEDGIVDIAGFQMTDTDSLICNYLAMILQQGGQYLKDDGSIDFATPEGITAMEEVLSMIDNGESDLENLVNGEYCFNNVYQDRAYMASAGSWAIGEGATYDLSYGEDFEYVPVPKYGEQMGFASETGWGLIVPGNGKNVDAAWEFVKFFSRPENLVEHNIACNQLPPRSSLLDSEIYKEKMPNISFLLEILPEGQWMGPYNTSDMRAVFNEMFINLAQMSPEERDVETALREASEKITNTAKISYAID